MSLDITLLEMQPVEVYTTNITHNLNKMADAAGLYYAMWHPETIGIQWAYELIPILEEGLAKLKATPDDFAQYEPENGWGSRAVLIECVEHLLEACKQHPNSTIDICR